MLIIDPLTKNDWERVREIYLEGIASGNSTFETESPGWEKWDRDHLQTCRLIARIEDRVEGWAALSAVSSRLVYSGVAEVSVYISEEARGKGLGTALLTELIKRSEENNIWTLQAGIFPENLSSIAIHRKCGFREVGRRERIGKMGNRWRDTILLERRSSIIGID